MSTIEQALEATPPEPETKEVEVNEIEDLKKKLESANQRIEDTYRAFQAGQERIASLERSQAAAAREAMRPAILQENEGLEEAMRWVKSETKAEADEPTEADKWIHTVSMAIPDAEKLMEDQEFAEAARAERERIGAQWRDPITAIRSLALLRAEHVKKKAIEEDRRSRAGTNAKADAMEIPGGGGKSPRRDPAPDDVKRILEMSDADFEKMRNRVLTGG